MKENLIISLIENNPVWEDVETNLHSLETLLKEKITDIVILPEMFATGFSMNTIKISQKEEGSIVKWMKEISFKNKWALCGSVSIEEDGNYYNRFYFVAEGKVISKYNKRHLFTYGKEDKYYTKGSQRVIFNYMGWKFCPMICYDLRFPVWQRNVEDYDILLNVANWPKKRIEIWNILHKARAVENQCFAIGVNRQGIDGNELEYNGQSQCVSPTGEVLTPINVHNTILTFEISKIKLQKIRTHFPFLKDKDSFVIFPKNKTV